MDIEQTRIIGYNLDYNYRPESKTWTYRIIELRTGFQSMLAEFDEDSELAANQMLADLKHDPHIVEIAQEQIAVKARAEENAVWLMNATFAADADDENEDWA